MCCVLCAVQDPAIELVRELQAAQEERASAATPELSKADVQGLLFGGGGVESPANDFR